MPTRLVFFSLLIALATASSAAAQAQQPAAPPSPATTAQTGNTNNPSTTTATQPTFEVGLGYQYLRAGELCFDGNDEDCSSARNYPLGFAIDGVRNFGALGLVGEVGWSRHSEDFGGDVTGLLDSGTIADNLFHYAAGVRFTGHNAGRAWPYGQILIGGITSHTSVDFDNDTTSTADEASDTTTRFIIQPGVGLTVIGGDGWGVFGQVDYRRILLKKDEDGSSGRNDIRAFVGLRLALD